MTGSEKKMENYIRSVSRRLNLPKEVRSRVMSDFTSAIAARRESGMTDAQIYAQLGKPKKAAADLNEQMKEFAYHKSPWRFLFAAAAVYGGWQLLGGILVNLVYLWYRFRAQAQVMGVGMTTVESASIGIIGGADGPTAVFVTTPVWMHYILPVLALSVGIWGYRRLCRCTRK